MTRRSLGVAFALLLIAGAKSAVAQSNVRNISTESELVDAVANPTVPGSPSLDTLALQNSLFLTAPLMLPLGTGPTFQVGNGLLLQGAFTGLSTLRKRGAGTLYLMSPFNSPFGIQAFEGTVELAPGLYSKIDVAGTLRARGPTIITSLDASGATMDTGWSVVVADTFSGRLAKVGSGNLVIFNRTPGATDDEIEVRGGTLTLRTGERLRLTLDGGTLRTGPTEIENLVTLGAAGGTFDTSDVLFLTGGVTGSGRLVKSGAGVLLLAGPSSYTGGTTVLEGSLQGDTASLTGAIRNDAMVVFAQPGDGAFAGGMTGTGRVLKLGSGVLTLNGVQSHAGGTLVLDGTLQVSSDASLGAGGAELTLDAGRLRAAGAFSLSRAIQLGAGGGTIDTQGFTLALGRVTGAGGLTKTGTGTLVLQSPSDFSGGTLVQAGTLQGSAATLQGHITNFGTVVFDQTSDQSFGGVILGGGRVRKTGAGVATFALAQSYTGLTTVAGGRLNVNGLAGSAVVDAGAVLGVNGDIEGGATVNGTLVAGGGPVALGSLAGSGTVQLGGGRLTLGADQSSTAFDGTIGGAGGLSKVGAGTLTLTGANTYTDGTSVTGGALRFNSDASLGAAGSTLTLDGGTAQTLAALTVSQTVVTGAQGGTFDTNGHNVSLTGLGGNGPFTKIGAGNLSIGAATALSGPLRIDGGMVSGALAQLPSRIENNATLNATQALDGTYTGGITGSGSVLKSGVGSLTFAEAQTYTGLTQVMRGQLRVAGLGGSVLVDAAATFTGTGRVAGDAIIFGTLVSGFADAAARNLDASAITTTAAPLSIAGNLTMEAGSTFVTSLSPTGATYLDVGGRASFNGGRLIVNGVRTGIGRAGTFTLFKAAGGVSGRFREVVADVPVDAFLSTRGDNVLVTLERTDIPFATLATTMAGTAAGAALDAARADASDDLHAVIGEIGALSDAETADALDQIGGSVYAASGRQGALEGQRTVRLVGDRLADLRAQAAVEAAGSPGAAAGGGRGLHVWFRTGADLSTVKSVAADSKVTGTMVGGDRTFGDRWTVGAFGGYERGTLTTNDGRGRIEDRRYRAGGYVSRTAASGVFVDVAAGAASHDYEAGRRMSFVATLDPSLGGGALFGGVVRSTLAQPRAWETSGFVDAGLARRLGSTAVQPFAGLEWSRLTRDAFMERGANAISLTVGESRASSARATGGLRVSHTVGFSSGRWLAPRAEVRYAGEMLDATASTTASFADAPLAPFTVESAAFGRHSTLISAGVAAAANRRLVISADYRGVLESRAQAHLFSLGVTF